MSYLKWNIYLLSFRIGKFEIYFENWVDQVKRNNEIYANTLLKKFQKQGFARGVVNT